MIQVQRKIRRQEKILSTLDDLNYATRKQLQVIEKLGGDRNAHRILHEMEKDKLISSIRAEQKIYYVSNKGKGVIGSHKGDLSKDRLTHTIMRNDLYIKLNMPKNWKEEQPITWGDDRKIIPDAIFRKGNEFHFVEIDNRQKMQTNIEKIKQYKSLSKAIFQDYKHTPTLIWYSLSDIRKEKLANECVKKGLKHIIY
ncbi:replication-relaxation family protein [Virgibacillus salexigens]|uniref:Replication-relaxation n=1 Tax=Virgibacillus massiliensis TaxID=1462526 RepID=A0A024QBK5_9BACI|nr:replication-relaxation family protein [Virgibacillus massiliensis]CDQ39570.1 hypothetical protein BN990_01875 [Virgibacillus massiliensis]